MLLTFSMVSTSVSADLSGQYYRVGFHGRANGNCIVYGQGEPHPGKGRVHIRGFAIAIRLDTDLYGAYIGVDPNTTIWARGASMTVKWDNKKLVVHIWSDDGTDGAFWNNTNNRILLDNLRFSGHYLEDPATPPQYIEGTVFLGFSEPSPVVGLYIEWMPFITFLWSDAHFQRVSVWPIE